MATLQQQQASRDRRLLRLNSRVEWFGDQVLAGVEVTAEGRVRFAAQYIRDKIVFNISIPVMRSGEGFVQRSIDGEFPRADTTRLMKDIFFQESGSLRYQVGTTLDYGLRLELHMNRSFLMRTLNEELNAIRRILTVGGGFGGGAVFNTGPV